MNSLIDILCAIAWAKWCTGVTRGRVSKLLNAFKIEMRRSRASRPLRGLCGLHIGSFQVPSILSVMSIWCGDLSTGYDAVCHGFHSKQPFSDEIPFSLFALFSSVMELFPVVTPLYAQENSRLPLPNASPKDSPSAWREKKKSHVKESYPWPR
jgi:hypothetical protein